MQPCVDFRNEFSCDICVVVRPIPRPQGKTIVFRTIRIRGTVLRVMYLPSRNLAPCLHPFFLRLGPDVVEFAYVVRHERQVEPKFSSWSLISADFGQCFHVISIR